ncbi:MAG: antiterminator LoaP [Lachnospiraceae bacterium]|nr:antiterminator LoaP [Lachnospiraceae bacterium]
MWYVIQVRTGKEEDVRKALQNVVMEEGEEVFIPTYIRERRYRGESRFVEAHLFPGYVFFDSEDPMGLRKRLWRTPLLTKLLKADNDYLPLYEEEEKMLKRLGGPVHRVEPSKGFIEGEEVRVFVGPLSGMEAQITHIDRHKRVATVSVMLCGRETEMKVGLEIVDKRK